MFRTKRGVPVSFSRALSVNYVQASPCLTPVQKEALTVFLSELDAVRDAVVLSPTPGAVGRYLTALETLLVKFPIGPGDIKLAFSWYDTSGSTKKPPVPLTMMDAPFEYAAQAYNLAMSLVASDLDLKAQAGAYCQAAFVLQSVIPPLVQPLLLPAESDLHPSRLHLKSICALAKAQECFLRKAMHDGSSDKVVAKLADGVADLCARYTASDDDGAALRLLSLEMRALALARRATDAERAGRHGERVAYLQAAARLDEAKFREQLKAATRDNDLIYNDPVPTALPAIPSAVMAAPAKYCFPSDELRGLSVLRALPDWPEHHAQWKTQTEAAASICTAMDHISGLLAAEATCIPHEEDEEDVAADGRLELLLSSLEAVRKARSECTSTCDAISAALHRECQTDAALKSRFTTQWTRPTSEAAMQPIRGQLESLQGLMREAAAADDKLGDRIGKERDGHERRLSAQPVRHALREAVAELRRLQAQRQPTATFSYDAAKRDSDSAIARIRSLRDQLPAPSGKECGDLGDVDELQRHLDQGLTFYTQLHTRLLQLLAECEDTVLSRQLDGEEHSEYLLRSRTGGASPPANCQQPATPGGAPWAAGAAQHPGSSIYQQPSQPGPYHPQPYQAPQQPGTYYQPTQQPGTYYQPTQQPGTYYQPTQQPAGSYLQQPACPQQQAYALQPQHAQPPQYQSSLYSTTQPPPQYPPTWNPAMPINYADSGPRPNAPSQPHQGQQQPPQYQGRPHQ